MLRLYSVRDQDFYEVAKDVRSISQKAKSMDKNCECFSVGNKHGKKIGIEGTDWIEIDRKMYDECIDPKITELLGKRRI